MAKTQRVISFHYTLTDPKGKTLDSSRDADPLAYLEGVGQIIPGLEAELALLGVGDKKVIQVAAAQAYGDYNLEHRFSVPRDKLPQKTVAVGDQFQSPENPYVPLTVVEVNDTSVTLDANHPLAGVDLTFDVEITEVRDATADELQHGHAHGPDGHHH